MSDTPANTHAPQPEEKWTEVEHLPEWDEEFYHVYTARKFGKWVMLKTLRPEFRDDPKYRAMLGQEFDVRYNLCHPNIVMINDLEDVPGVGRSIITDDVYGDSLARLIEKGEVSDLILDKIIRQLPEAIAYIQENHIVHHPIRPETIIFTENVRNLKLIDVGFEQREHLTGTDVSDDIRNYGKVLQAALDAADNRDPHLRRVVQRCLTDTPRRRYHDVQELKVDLGGSVPRRLYLVIIMALLVLCIFLAWLTYRQPAL